MDQPGQTEQLAQVAREAIQAVRDGQTAVAVAILERAAGIGER
ncbi:hypothetical protein [Actinopolymorpha alba]|nr:hypothetical protein [Actinopolymorpha alba]